ncbi:hypothetical protein HUJ04_004129 [Dendroctonus ponderosae]|nr:hypothetical protein HUJ04_004129 [Dendroctonus ponderosae]
MWAFGALVVYGTVLAAALSTEEPAVAIQEGAEGEEATTTEATPKDFGVALTGILPSNLGNLVFSPNGSGVALNGSSFPLFPDKQVRVTKNISTVDKHQSANILSGISDVLGLSKLVSSRNNQEGESKLSK